MPVKKVSRKAPKTNGVRSTIKVRRLIHRLRFSGTRNQQRKERARARARAEARAEAEAGAEEEARAGA